MYSVFLLNTSSFPALDITTLNEFLSKTFPRALIKCPSTHLELTTSIQQSQSSSTLFLLLNNKNKNSSLEDVAYELTQRQKKFLVYYTGLQKYSQRTVRTYDEIVRRVKKEFYGQNEGAKRSGDNRMLVVTGESSSMEFRTGVHSIKSKIQQLNMGGSIGITVQQNYDFSDTVIFEESPYNILIMNDQELYKYEGQYSNLLNKIPKNKLVTIVFSKTANIPYGFRFDQLATNDEELSSKTLWFIRQHNKNTQLPVRHNTLIESISSINRQSNFRSAEHNRSPTYKRTTIIDKQNGKQYQEDERSRKKSMQSQARRQSRKSRSSQRQELLLNFNWVCKKKPSGNFATISESEYRKHGIRSTYYGNQGLAVGKEKRSSIVERRESSLLKAELEKLENKLKQQPSIMVHRNSVKEPLPTSQFESQSTKVMNVEPNANNIKVSPRRHSSTAGYNQLNLQELLLFQQSLPAATDSIPSTMSFGSLESTSKQAHQEQPITNTSKFQNNYYNTSQLPVSPRNSSRLEPSIVSSSYQLYNLHNSNSPNNQIKSNNNAARSSQRARSKPRLSTLKFRVPIIYLPSSLPNLRYLINITYPHRFSLIDYRNLSQLEEYIENLDGSMKPTVIFDEYHAIQAQKIINFNQQKYIRAIVYSSKQQNLNFKAYPGITLANNDNILLLEVNKIQR